VRLIGSLDKVHYDIKSLFYVPNHDTTFAYVREQSMFLPDGPHARIGLPRRQPRTMLAFLYVLFFLMLSPPLVNGQQDRMVKPSVAETINRSWEAYRKGETNRALSLLRPVLNKNDLPADIYLLGGKLYYNKNQFRRAAREFRRSLDRLGNHSLTDQVNHYLDRATSLLELDLRERRYSHFTVLSTSNLPPGAPGNLNFKLEKARRRIGGDLDLYPDQRFTVILYPRPEFRRVVEAPVWSGGVFDGKIHIPYRRDSTPPFPQRTLYHEYAHAIVHLLARNSVPLWFNEGFATFQEHRHARDAFNYRYIKQNPPEQTLRNLSQISELFKRRENREQARLAYEYSYSFVKFLKERHGLISLKQIINETGRTNDFADAVYNVTGRSLQSLQYSWETWLDGELGP
jgi:tetratricopeptide (TPR) repeat protein